MERQMSATQTRINFGEVLRYVSQEQRPVIVAHSGKPQAVILSMEDYQEFQRLKAEQPKEDVDVMLDRLRQLRAQIADRRGGEPLPDAAEIIHQMREERDAQLIEACGLR